MNAAAAGALGLARLDFPKGWWVGREVWLVAATVAVALVPFVQFAFSERGEKRRRQELEREGKINAILASLLVQSVKMAGAHWEQTGIQAFAVRTTLWDRVLRREHQVRVGKVRLSSVASSGLKWTKGKGLIGRCWDQQKHTSANLEAHFRPYLNFTRDQWDKLSHEARFGLGFEEFDKIKDKYGIVAAVPIVNKKDEYIGCITADMPPGPVTTQVNRSQLLSVLAVGAVLVGQILSE